MGITDTSLVMLMHCKELEHIASGKVREIFRIKNHPGFLLIYVTDRWSAYDFVFGFPMESFGVIRNFMTIHWKGQLMRMGIPTDLFAWGRSVDDFLPSRLRNQQEFWKRCTVVHDLDMLPVEIIHRSNAGGSLARAAKKARDNGHDEFEFCGHVLPSSIQSGYEFSLPLSTPTTKETDRHDENVDTLTIERECPGLQDFGLMVFMSILTALAVSGRGRILDWKGEFGRRKDTGQLVWADEFSPDSARFCWEEDYPTLLAGGTIEAQDKEFGRLYMATQHPELTAPGVLSPENPNDRKTVAEWRESPEFLYDFGQRYRNGFFIATGEYFEDYSKLVLDVG